MSNGHPLYAAANDADEAWHAALVRTYGSKATEARYDPKRNRATPELAALHDAKKVAIAAWLKHMSRTA